MKVIMKLHHALGGNKHRIILDYQHAQTIQLELD